MIHYTVLLKNQKTTVDKIKADNKLNSNSIKVGQILKMK
nr:LysM peptidoglycan-binding domain-containing protein [Staphylococcus saprophyticus]